MIKLFPTYISFSSFKFPRKDWWGIKSKDAPSPSVPTLTLHLFAQVIPYASFRATFRIAAGEGQGFELSAAPIPLCQDVGQFHPTPRITR